MGKLNAGAFATGLFKRLLNPVHVARAAKLQWRRKQSGRARDDAQLKLYGQLFPSDFLHYGYFDDVDRRPEDMSLDEVLRAQARYAEVLLEQVIDRAHPVLDVGCGMGGLSGMLRERGYVPVALTPNRTQATHVREKYAGVELHECKLEDWDWAGQRGRFGTVVTSESLQYLKLDRALPVIEGVLRPGGRWVACDYFRRQPSEGGRSSGHVWDDFMRTLEGRGWRVTFERDITPNILPTLKSVHMWASRMGLPLMEFGLQRLRRKQPGVHYLLEDGLAVLQRKARENVETVNPETFARSKKYVLLVMERA